MANKQPFFHEVQILFTTTSGKMLSQQKINVIKAIIARQQGICKQYEIEVIEAEPNPGDPADLL